MYVELYNDSTLKNRYVFWDVYNKKPEKPVCSLFYKPDYGIVHLVYLRKLKNCFEVLVNNNQKKYVPFKKKVIVQLWDGYLKSLNGISFYPDSSKHYIFSAPNKNSKALLVGDDETKSYCVSDIQGDWIRIRLDCDEDPTPCNQQTCNTTGAVEGWIRWRNGNQLLVQFSFLC